LLLLLALFDELLPTQVPFFLSANTLSPLVEGLGELEFLTELEDLPPEALADGLLVFTNLSL
jgi:hypothetical protein